MTELGPDRRGARRGRHSGHSAAGSNRTPVPWLLGGERVEGASSGSYSFGQPLCHLAGGGHRLRRQDLHRGTDCHGRRSRIVGNETAVLVEALTAVLALRAGGYRAGAAALQSVENCGLGQVAGDGVPEDRPAQAARVAQHHL
ncbi:hypothetical protein ACFWCA_36755 [Streptomyces phaeochromogenes]|uniref:hypothetical protein n=1 Tax=Streptomyces phaeochromogenes TaxID=1923 RepID=UPI00368AEF19